MPLPAGSIKITKVVSGTLAVDITRVSGGSLTVYSDSALTTSVSMPDSISASKTYYLADADHYTVSVKRGGNEIASDGDSTVTVSLVDGQALNIAPTVDPNKVSALAESATLAGNTFTGQQLLPDGTVGAPSLSNTGDTNTGLYFPADDSVGLAVGGVVGLSVDSAGLLSGAGTSLGAAVAYTPTWTNLTVGAATQVFKYTQIGKQVRVSGRLVFAADTSITGGGPTFTLPVTAAAVASTRKARGNATLFDAGTETFYGVVAIQTTTTAWIRTMTVSGSTVRGSAVDATSPFTWTTSDEILVDFWYEAA